MATYILPTGVVVMFCADAFFRASHLQLLTYSYVMWSQLLLLWHYWHSSMTVAYTAISVNKCGPAKFVALVSR